MSVFQLNAKQVMKKGEILHRQISHRYVSIAAFSGSKITLNNIDGFLMVSIDGVSQYIISPGDKIEVEINES